MLAEASARTRRVCWRVALKLRASFMMTSSPGSPSGSSSVSAMKILSRSACLSGLSAGARASVSLMSMAIGTAPGKRHLDLLADPLRSQRMVAHDDDQLLAHADAAPGGAVEVVAGYIDPLVEEHREAQRFETAAEFGGIAPAVGMRVGDEVVETEQQVGQDHAARA